MFFFFLTSGLFLGWTLGANDAANVFGSAVGSKMIRFKQAAIISSIFVILGAVLQGAGGSHTLGKLGSVDALGGAFTIALAAGFSVFMMTKYKLPVSTTQAVVGAIIGWNLFTGSQTDMHSLVKIVTTWVAGPILGGVFALVMYLALRGILRKSKIHLIRLDAYTRTALLLVGAFGSYSLGANNIANVVGVFVPSVPDIVLDFGWFRLDGVQLLFLIGGLAIATGIITYSKRVMLTVGDSIMKLSPETAFIVVFAHSIVLFVFSSQGLSNLFVRVGLPPIPLVPVSSSQVIVGAIMGIALLKGGRTIDYRVLGQIAIGWVATPVIAGIVSFFSLFFMANVFNLVVTHKTVANVISHPSSSTTPPAISNLSKYGQQTIDLYGVGLIFLLVILLFLVGYLLWKNFQLKQINIENDYNEQILRYNEQQAKLEYELKITNNQNARLEAAVKEKKKTQKRIALSIIHKNEVLNQLKLEIAQIKSKPETEIKYDDLNSLELLIINHLDLEKDRKVLNKYLEELNAEFFENMEKKFPNLTEKEKRLSALLRLNLSSKELASILGISAKSVEVNRYRLRKKLNLKKDQKLSNVLGKL